MKDGVMFMWNERTQEAFQLIQEALVAAPVLRFSTHHEKRCYNVMHQVLDWELHSCKMGNQLLLQAGRCHSQKEIMSRLRKSQVTGDRFWIYAFPAVRMVGR